MPKKTVLTFSTAYFPFVGGAEIAIKETARRLKGDFDFIVITSRMDKRLSRTETSGEGKIIRVGYGRSWDKLLLPVLGYLQVRKLLKGKSDACLWGMDISQGSLAAALYKFFHPQMNFIFTVQYGESPEKIKSGRWGLNKMLFKFMLKQADQVTVISSYLAGLVKKFGYAGKVSVIHNGVDVSLFEDKNRENKKDGKTIITTSRLVEKNGIDILIRAVSEVRKKIPEIKCLIVGSGPQKEKLVRLVKELNLSASVEFLGNVPYEEIPKYLHRADVFVRPSRSEGMGNSFVEALAAGLPIIGTPVGGILDIIEDGKTGLFTRVDDPADLAFKIERLLKDQVLSRRMVEYAKTCIGELFSWDKISQSFKQIFLSKTSLKIAIATPLYPPQIGGPGLYAKNLSDEFKKSGHKAAVLSFGDFLSYPSSLRHLFYFFRFWSIARRADLIFCLDQFSVGLPCAVVSLLTGRPLVLRVEGDFLWERFVERTKKDVLLADFDPGKQKLTFKESIISRTVSWVTRTSTRNVFSSEWRRRIVVKNLKLDIKATKIIRNVWPQANKSGAAPAARKKQVLWAGRMIYIKNLYRLIQAFSEVNENYELRLVGDGPEAAGIKNYVCEKKISEIFFSAPLPQDKLHDVLRESAFFILPSISEVGPNLIGESVSAGTPFIMTKESGYAGLADDLGMLVDPLDLRDLKDKIREMMDEDVQKKYRDKITMSDLKYAWPEAAQDWLKIFHEII